MSIKDVQNKLADAYQLLSMSKGMLDKIDPLCATAEYENIVLIRKNIRDALNLINAAEAELDNIRGG